MSQRKMTSILWIFGALLIVALAIPSGADAAAKKWRIGLCTWSTINEWGANVTSSTAKTLEVLGADLLMTNAQNDWERQARDVESMVARKVDLIVVLGALRKPLEASIASAGKAGIPIVSVESYVQGPTVKCEIAVDQYVNGIISANEIINYSRGKAKILSIFRSGFYSLDIRNRGWKMKLGEKDESGRCRPVKIENSDFYLYFNTVIIAVGQTVELDFLKDRQWKPVKAAGETAIKNVYIGGDALRGPSSIITAAADGKKAALSIIKSFTGSRGGFSKEPLAAGGAFTKKLTLADYQQKFARRIYGEDPLEMTGKSAQKEAQRCLFCSDTCNICVMVCPNRANVSYTLEPVEYLLQKAINRDGKIEITADEPFRLTQPYQVYNIADFCNGCGNCRTFCPTSGAPYKDKPKICLTAASFQAEPHGFFMGEENGKWFIKSKKENGDWETLFLETDRYIYETAWFSAALDKNNLRVKDIRFKSSSPFKEVNFKRAAEMSILFTAFKPWFAKET